MFEIEKLHPQIFIFKNALKNPDQIIKHFNLPIYYSVPWYTFGEQIEVSNETFNFEEFPTKDEWDLKTKTIGQNEAVNFFDNFLKKNIQNGEGFGLNLENISLLEDGTNYIKNIADLFYETTKIYFENTSIKKQLMFNSFNIAKYYPDAGVGENLAMNYHTDFRQEISNTNGYNFYVTCLFYLNDDFSEGEICFKVLDEKQEKIEFSVEYKPSAGDIVIFPSTPPFYHGVKKSRNKEKYIIRTYWKSMEQGNLNFDPNKSTKNSFLIYENNQTYYFQGYRTV